MSGTSLFLIYFAGIMELGCMELGCLERRALEHEDGANSEDVLEF